MSFYIIFFLIVCIVLLWVTIGKKEAYPFSYYPMYSSPHDIANICVFRIALKKVDGSVIWWKSEFFRYPEYVGRGLKQLWDSRSDTGERDIFLQLEQKRLLLSVLRIIEKEEPGINNYSDFCIVERTINTRFDPVDRTIALIPISKLRDGLV